MRLLLLAAVLGAATTAAPSPGYVDAELIASSMAPRPGSTIVAGFRMTPKPGWHGYWSNPGESGLAPTVSWTAPSGVRFGALLHPPPTLMQSMGVVSYIHSGPHVLLSRMTVSAAIKPGTLIPVTADLNWAACSKTQCVPQHARLSLQMVAGDGTKSPDAPALRQALNALPRPAPSGIFSTTDGQLILQLPVGLRLSGRAVHFFPDANGYFKAAQAHMLRKLPLTIAAPASGRLPHQIAGVVSDGTFAYQLSFHRGETAYGSPKSKPAPADAPTATVPHSPRPAVNAAPSGAAGQVSIHGISRLIRALVLLGLLGLGVFGFALARRSFR